MIKSKRAFYVFLRLCSHIFVLLAVTRKSEPPPTRQLLETSRFTHTRGLQRPIRRNAERHSAAPHKLLPRDVRSRNLQMRDGQEAQPARHLHKQHDGPRLQRLRRILHAHAEYLLVLARPSLAGNDGGKRDPFGPAVGSVRVKSGGTAETAEGGRCGAGAASGARTAAGKRHWSRDGKREPKSFQNSRVAKLVDRGDVLDRYGNILHDFVCFCVCFDECAVRWRLAFADFVSLLRQRVFGKADLRFCYESFRRSKRG